jgi:hypothetical protein
MIGRLSRKIIAVCILSKQCAICDKHTKAGTDGPEHYCPCNHEGSSKAMESAAGVKLLEQLHDNKRVSMRYIVADDDSTIRAKCKHSIKDLIAAGKLKVHPRDPVTNKRIPCYGRLRLDISVPIWRADPSHRTKVVGKHVFKLAWGPRKITKCTKADALRLKRNFGYFQKQTNRQPFPEFKRKSKTVIEHHFNNHSYCDASWCPIAKAGKTKGDPIKYRDDVRDAELKAQLVEIIDVFTTEEKLLKIHHQMDSQKNEALNKSVTKYAPKDREYSKSKSLESRILIAGCTNNVGISCFYKRLFHELGMSLGSITRVELKTRERNRLRKQEYVKKKGGTRGRRSKQNAEKTKRLIDEDIKARKKEKTMGQVSLLPPLRRLLDNKEMGHVGVVR